MKTIDDIMELMVGGSVIANHADLLREKDEEFPEAEKKFQRAVKILRAELPKDHSPTCILRRPAAAGAVANGS